MFWRGLSCLVTSWFLKHESWGRRGARYRHGVKPHAVHATFTPGGLAIKKARFRETNLWLNEPPSAFLLSYFLTYENTVEVGILRAPPLFLLFFYFFFIGGVYVALPLMIRAALLMLPALPLLAQAFPVEFPCLFSLSAYFCIESSPLLVQLGFTPLLR